MLRKLLLACACAVVASVSSAPAQEKDPNEVLEITVVNPSGPGVKRQIAEWTALAERARAAADENVKRSGVAIGNPRRVIVIWYYGVSGSDPIAMYATLARRLPQEIQEKAGWPMRPEFIFDTDPRFGPTRDIIFGQSPDSEKFDAILARTTAE